MNLSVIEPTPVQHVEPQQNGGVASEAPPPKPLSVRESNPSAIISPHDAPDYEELAARFRPIFARIASSAIPREQSRSLAFAEVAELRTAGFHKIRIPVSYGGFGATVPQLFRLLVELAEADSNISHLFRGHFAFLEGRLNLGEKAAQELWFERVVGGAIIGYAMAERTAHTGGDCRIFQEEGKWYIDGTKYYSTGTVYADWIVVSAVDGEEYVGAAVPVDAPGVVRLDDWDGFGQRLTGSGTTKFERVQVPERDIVRRFSAAELFTHSYQKSFLQLILLSSITGSGRAALREGLDFVRPRTRAFGIPGKSSPKDDPLVHRVIGRVSSLVYSSQSLVETIARVLEELYQAAVVGTAVESDFVEAEIKTFQAQQIVIQQILEAVTSIFEVGGASATSESRRLDRHWRNVRTAASHNPLIHREQAIGDFLLNGTVPDAAWRAAFEKKKKSEAPTVAAA
jgi:alkylation response protein AidB-like acyl-CoA dehydrogenase